MFQANEYVVYGRSGVCRVDGIETINGKGYYCLRAIYQNCQIKTPLDGKIPIRRVITKEQANTLIDSIPSMKASPVNCSNVRELSEKYRTSVLTQECRDLLSLIMSIYEKKKTAQKEKKKLSTTDQTFIKEGESLLFGELAIALEIPFDEVQSYIRKRVEIRKSSLSESQLHSLHKF